MRPAGHLHVTTCWLCSLCSACSRALEHPRAAVSAETTTTHQPWKLCQWGFSALLCSAVWGENASLDQTTTLQATSLWCSSNSVAVMLLQWSRRNTSTEPLNPQNVIGDHSFKQLWEENKYLYRILSSKCVDQEYQKVLISEAATSRLGSALRIPTA